MKRTKQQVTVGSKGPSVDSSESSDEMYYNGTSASSSPHGNIRYSLRNRAIFYFNKCEKHDESVYISDKNNVSVSQALSVLGTSYAETSSVTESFRGRLQIGVNIFAQQVQRNVKHSINYSYECEPTIMRLPNEVLTMIFSYFDVRELSISVAPVCKRWYTVAHSSVLWRKLCFNGDEISTEHAKSLLTKSPLLSELVISNR
jgi:hypothetical protein